MKIENLRACKIGSIKNITANDDPHTAYTEITLRVVNVCVLELMFRCFGGYLYIADIRVQPVQGGLVSRLKY